MGVTGLSWDNDGADVYIIAGQACELGDLLYILTDTTSFKASDTSQWGSAGVQSVALRHSLTATALQQVTISGTSVTVLPAWSSTPPSPQLSNFIVYADVTHTNTSIDNPLSLPIRVRIVEQVDRLRVVPSTLTA